MINPNQELKIRREFSSSANAFEGLRAWIFNNLAELKDTNKPIYDFRIQLKPIDNLLNDANEIFQKGEKVETLEDIIENVDALICAEIIVYTPSDLLFVSSLLSRCKRIILKKGFIHCHEELEKQNEQLINELREVSVQELTTVPNKSGDFGVKYIIEPNFDDIYPKNKFNPYGKFELSARTVMNSAWNVMRNRVSEISQLEKDETTNESIFSYIWETINKSEREFIKSIINNQQAVSRTAQVPHDNPPYESELLGKIKKHIKDFEENKKEISLNDKCAIVTDFKSKYFEKIEKISSIVTEENVSFNMELAELYLKSKHYKWSYALYSKCRDGGGYRRKSVSNDNEQQQIVQEFESEFESKKQECAVLIVDSTSTPNKWTIAGFNDNGQFKSVLIDDSSNELSVELKKESADESKIMELVTSSLGRTRTPRDRKLFNDSSCLWLWLRLAEVCKCFPEKGKEVVTYIKNLEEALDKNKTRHTEKELSLFTQGAVIAWEYGLLDTAVKLGTISVALLTEVKNKDDIYIRVKANFVYYMIVACKKNYPNDLPALKRCLNEVEPYITYIEYENNKSPVHTNDLDTIAWYHYCLADIKCDEGKIRSALREIKLADTFSNKCSQKWEKQGYKLKGASNAVLVHAGSINKMKEHLESMKTNVFIGYSHNDKAWLNRLVNVYLKPLVREERIAVWSDQKIKASQKWKGEIEKALAKAEIAILLISADFMASDFIVETEVPTLLNAAATEGVRILPLFVGHCPLDRMKELTQYQAVNDPSKPLDGMDKAESDKILSKLSEDVNDIIEK